MIEDVLLSSTVTIAKYRHLEAEEDRAAIADFLKNRFAERYISPLQGDPKMKHGFCTMAISCLMVEALESFWQGWSNTNGNSRKAFRKFFQRCLDQNLALGTFAEGKKNELTDDFYKGVRCGILHQAETTNGWRIRRKGALYDPETRTINATKFHKELEKVLRVYCDTLKNSKWDSEIWKNLRQKMDAVIKNCERS